MKTKQIKNFKMNDVTYKMRRSVIEILYTAKSKGIILPRINVRIGESTHNYPNVLGVGGNLNIWITKTAIDRSSDYLLHVVLHELCHAIFNLPHNESCPLMASVLDKPCTNAQAWKIFEGYYYENVRTVREIHYHASKCAMAS